MLLYKIYKTYIKIIDKLRSEFIYRNLFKDMGKNVSIAHSLYCVNPQNIEIGNLVRIGPNCRIESFTKYQNKDSKGKFIFSEGVHLEHGVHVYAAEQVFFGKNVLVASNCCITDENHGMNPLGESYLNQPLEYKEVLIEEEVWLGEGVMVLPGSYIGKRCIIGANSVVSGRISEYTIAAGNPAKVIKKWNFKNCIWEKIPGVNKYFIYRIFKIKYYIDHLNPGGIQNKVRMINE